MFTGCYSPAEGVTQEERAAACWNWHGWQTGRALSPQWKILMSWLDGAGLEEAVCGRHKHFAVWVKMIKRLVRRALQDLLTLHCQRFPVKTLTIRVCGTPPGTERLSSNLVAQRSWAPRRIPARQTGRRSWILEILFRKNWLVHWSGYGYLERGHVKEEPGAGRMVRKIRDIGKGRREEQARED